MIRKAIFLPTMAALPLLLAGCGDDLESRNAAVVGEEAPGGEPEMVLTPGRQGEDSRDAAESAAFDNGFAGQQEDADDDDDTVVVDAEPADLIDSAEGFDPTPMDVASGIDPDPQSGDWADTE